MKIPSKILKICYPNAEVINDSAVNFYRENYYNFYVANPPFNLTIFGDKNLGYDCLKKDKDKFKCNSDNFFLEQAVRSLKVGGYGIFILPPEIGFKAALKKTRQFIMDNCWIIANIELCADTFAESGTNIKTHILIFRKAPKLPKFKCNSYDAYEKAEFLLGQPPIIGIQINDLSKNYTDCWEEYESQLDESFDKMTDDLWLYNTCPYPHHKDEANEMMYWGQGCDAYNIEYSGHSDKKDLMFFMIQTLGRGQEIEYDGVEYSTLDWDVMDELIEKYKGEN